MQETKNLSDFFHFAFDYLINQSKPLLNTGKLTVKDLQEYATDFDLREGYSLKDAFNMLIVCLQDYQSMPNIIQYKKREPIFKSILFDYDFYEVSKKWTPDTLFQEFCNKFPVNN